MFAIPEEEAMEEELVREETLADIPPLLTAFSSVSDLERALSSASDH